MTGEATRIAATKLRAKALDGGGRNCCRRRPKRSTWSTAKSCAETRAGPSVALGDMARASGAGIETRSATREPGLSAEGWFEASHMVYPYGIHIAVVRVDRDTGAVTVERYLVAYDIGRAVNPMLIEGQIAGGLAQGLGGALFEEFLYDPRGEPLVRHASPII